MHGGAASMGPRSDNRGYASSASVLAPAPAYRLQWVHGPITVVMLPISRRSRLRRYELQWVHGPITVVMAGDAVRVDVGCDRASMGPRSDNRGYGDAPATCSLMASQASMGPRSDNRGYGRDRAGRLRADRPLQWVHGPITVVMRRPASRSTQRRMSASMGPRSDNRGYADRIRRRCARRCRLQWVHGPITVVMRSAARAGRPCTRRFNGSTVR